MLYFQPRTPNRQCAVPNIKIYSTVEDLDEITKPLLNAKVLAMEKQGEAAEKVMFGKESTEEQFILSSLAIAVALVLLSFI